MLISILKQIIDKIVPPFKMDKKEQIIYDIIKMLCQEEDTDLKIAPISGKYFMINKRLSYWIKVEDFCIAITNHKFTFTHTTNSVYHSTICDMVREFIEKDRKEFEEAIFQNEIELLENIKGSIISGSF